MFLYGIVSTLEVNSLLVSAAGELVLNHISILSGSAHCIGLEMMYAIAHCIGLEIMYASAYDRQFINSVVSANHRNCFD
jgi:hypothetical protein